MPIEIFFEYLSPGDFMLFYSLKQNRNGKCWETKPYRNHKHRNKMKKTKPILFTVLCILVFTSQLFSQTDIEQISAIRNASNLALKSYENKEVLSYLTDDVLITTGNGTLLSGKEELEKYILDGGQSKMYWVRDTKEIIINKKRGLAWETGIWNGYDAEKGDESIINGNYSAMWTKGSGKWKIKSQLFVTLGEEKRTMP